MNNTVGKGLGSQDHQLTIYRDSVCVPLGTLKPVFIQNIGLFNYGMMNEPSPKSPFLENAI